MLTNLVFPNQTVSGWTGERLQRWKAFVFPWIVLPRRKNIVTRLDYADSNITANLKSQPVLWLSHKAENKTRARTAVERSIDVERLVQITLSLNCFVKCTPGARLARVCTSLRNAQFTTFGASRRLHCVEEREFAGTSIAYTCTS